jgi:hypothetical protein
VLVTPARTPLVAAIAATLPRKLAAMPGRTALVIF